MTNIVTLFRYKIRVNNNERTDFIIVKVNHISNFDQYKKNPVNPE